MRRLNPTWNPGETPAVPSIGPRVARDDAEAATFDVEGFTLHEARPSSLDRIYRETRDLYAAKQLARHASVRTIEEYLHPSADDLRARMLESDRGKRA